MATFQITPFATLAPILRLSITCGLVSLSPRFFPLRIRLVVDLWSIFLQSVSDVSRRARDVDGAVGLGRGLEEGRLVEFEWGGYFLFGGWGGSKGKERVGAG